MTAFQMIHLPAFWLILLNITTPNVHAQQSGVKDYTGYYEQVNLAEELICSLEFEQALNIYTETFETYDFVFLNNYKIAAQIALYVADTQTAIHLVRESIKAGWSIKSLRNNNLLAPLIKDPYWGKMVQSDYDSLHRIYLTTLNTELISTVRNMYSKDQRKAIRALFAFGEKRQVKYAENKFAPHSEGQLSQFAEILNENGYPGEQLVGNDYWMTTILCHHNSISTAYNRNDTAYHVLKPLLFKALKVGQISPFEMALMDDWYRATLEEPAESTYGILRSVSYQDLQHIDSLRSSVYLRSIEVRNKLIEIEATTGLQFYLPGAPWIDGKILIDKKNH